MTLPTPLTPADCDLQDFPFMPLHVARLRDSDLAAEEHPEACWYAVMLWSAAWHQLPAGSLPDNETVLARLCGLGRDLKTFRKHRAGAMRGFITCDDGRLYHPVIAEQAIAAWEGKKQQRWRSECARIKKANQRNGTNLLAPTYEEFLAGVSPAPAAPSPEVVPGDTIECPPGQALQEKGTGTGRLKEEKSFALVAADATPGEGKVSAADVRVAFGLWNDMAKRSGLAVAKDFTDDRKRKIGVKLRLVGMEGWRSVLATIEASDFCRGGGERGWRITLDNLFQAKTWNTLRDGGYGAIRGGPAEFKPEVWAQLVGMWRSGEPWPEEAGPAPDQPGTRVPKELLVQQVRGAA
nr:DUF1376 domain-containing protein [uncultured Brevundimonas sp.]